MDLIKNSDDADEDERYVNLTAVLAGLSSEQKNFESDLLNLKETNYEIVYNKACIFISKGLYEAAIKKLNEAEGNSNSNMLGHI